MTYGTLTLYDAAGMLPFLSLLAVLVHGLMTGLAYVWSLFRKRRIQQHSSLSSSTSATGTRTTARPMIDLQSVLFLLFLSYLLSPLATTLHLRGKRQNLNLSRHDHGLHDLIHGVDPLLQEVIDRMPSLTRGPTPPLLFGNRHLQFIPWMIQNEIHRAEGIPYQRIELPVTACLDKTKGVNCVRSPLMNDTITLDVFPPFESHTFTSIDEEGRRAKYTGFDDTSPIIFFSPGLRCYSQDLPGTSIVRRAFGEGFRSVVVNRRGHTPDRKLQAPRWNLFGDVDDLEQVYWYIRREWAGPNTPYFLHGISSGTAVAVSALAEWDHRRLLAASQEVNVTTLGGFSLDTDDPVAPSFVGSVSITPGYDTSKVLLPERFKIPYNTLLTAEVKNHFIRQNEQVLRDYNSQAVDAALQADNLQEFLNAVAPFAGYPNATEYFIGENPVNFLHHITTPKLVLNSIDDPCCNIHNLYETSPYPQHQGKSYAQLVAESERGLIAVTKTGTHCPFLDSNEDYYSLLPATVEDPLNPGRWMLDSWADRVSVDFYKATLEVYNSRRFLQ